LRKAKAGDPVAADKFVHANMKLVISRALQHCDSRDPRIIDVISDGTVGLMTAIKRFDLKTPFRFSTYAVWWINCRIKKGLKTAKRAIPRMDIEIRTEFAKGLKEMIRLTDVFPTDAEVARYLKWDRHKLRVYQKSTSEPPIALQDIEYDLPDSSEPPAEIATRHDLKDVVASVLHKMSPIEEDIIRRRYGIDCNEETLIEIANFYNLAKERIRQIESLALRRVFILFADKGKSEEEDEPVADESEEDREKRLTKERAITAIKQMDPVTRDVLTSYYGIDRQKKTIDQIARLYDMPVTDVEDILERGIDQLDRLVNG
jgi:RNA polymerase primary sigma factor